MDLFDELNRRHWGGRLPRYEVVREDTPYFLGCCNRRARLIRLNSELSGEPLRAVLLHEMCHAALPDELGHGQPFQEELARLIARGESSLREEIAYCEAVEAQDLRLEMAAWRAERAYWDPRLCGRPRRGDLICPAWQAEVVDGEEVRRGPRSLLMPIGTSAGRGTGILRGDGKAEKSSLRTSRLCGYRG